MKKRNKLSKQGKLLAKDKIVEKTKDIVAKKRTKIGRSSEGDLLKSVKPKKEKVKKVKKIVNITYGNIDLSDDFKNVVRNIRKELVKQGCFFSYKQIIQMYFRHAKWWVFYKKDLNYKYPCGEKFKVIADRLITYGGYSEEDSAYLNPFIDLVKAFIKDNNVKRYYIRDFWGNVKRYRTILSLTEAMDDALSMIWEGIGSLGDVESPFFSNEFRYEKNLNILCVDFRSVNISGYDSSDLIDEISMLYEKE